jgi:formylglycine-generating enzyme required for sulfatase activity
MNSSVLHGVLCRRALCPAGLLSLLFPLGCVSAPPSQDQPDGGPSASPEAGKKETGGESGGQGDASVGAGDAPAFSCVGNAAKSGTVTVPAGNYIIGCNAAVDDECLSDELPMHTVTLSAFEIELTEVTQVQYATCVVAGSCSPPACTWDCSRGNYPAGCIVWDQAKEYCGWAGRRLPTEAEWEAAARGPTGLKYPWGNQEPDCTLTNMSGCTGASDPVGNHPTGASPFGALDMAGNVVEMVSDWFDATYYASSPAVNPSGPDSGTTYGGRGGGYASVAVWQRASSRDWYDLTDAYQSLGFRCAD